MIDALLGSLEQLAHPNIMLLMLLGIAIGFVVGVLPGLGGAVTLALMIPLTFDMSPMEAFAFLLGMSAVTATTGDITSILFGIPGETTTAATVLDGYPMTRRGEPGRALAIALFSSLLGALIGSVVLVLSVPLFRPVVLALGSPEFLMLTLLGLTFVITLSGGQVVKGVLMAMLGMIVAAVGIDPQGGIPRFSFGQLYLWDGIDIIPLVVGLFGGAELLQLMLTRSSISSGAASGVSPYTGMWQGVRDTLKHPGIVARSSAIGIGVGIIPGMGGAVAQFIAYGHARQTSKHPEEFGRGSVEGLIAAGANNNAKDAGSLIPTAAFGIPGGVAMAVLLGVFIMKGIDPGPEMLTKHLDLLYAMAFILVIANVIVVILAFPLLGLLAKLTFIKGTWLVPFLLVVLTVGSYSASNNVGDIIVMLCGAAMGVFAIQFGWPRLPFLLAVVLGGLTERYFFLSYSVYGWGWLSSPIVMGFGVAILVVLFSPAVRSIIAKRRNTRKQVSVQ